MYNKGKRIIQQKLLKLKVIIEQFAQKYESWEKRNLLICERKRYRKNKMSWSEMLLVVVYFHLSEKFLNITIYMVSAKLIEIAFKIY